MASAPGAAGAADYLLLYHLYPVRGGGAGEHRPGYRLQHLQIYPLYPGRAADCAGDLLIRIGAAENARQDGEAGLP